MKELERKWLFFGLFLKRSTLLIEPRLTFLVTKNDLSIVQLIPNFRRFKYRTSIRDKSIYFCNILVVSGVDCDTAAEFSPSLISPSSPSDSRCCSKKTEMMTPRLLFPQRQLYALSVFSKSPGFSAWTDVARAGSSWGACFRTTRKSFFLRSILDP